MEGIVGVVHAAEIREWIREPILGNGLLINGDEKRIGERHFA